MPLHLQSARFPRFLNLRASKRPHRRHWQTIFRVAHQKTAKEQPYRRRRSWDASRRSDAAKPLFPPGLGVIASSPWLCSAGRSSLAVLSLQAGIPDPSPLQPPRTSPPHTRVLRASLSTAWALPKRSQCRKRGDGVRVGCTPHLLSRTLGSNDSQAGMVMALLWTSLVCGEQTDRRPASPAGPRNVQPG